MKAQRVYRLRGTPGGFVEVRQPLTMRLRFKLARLCHHERPGQRVAVRSIGAAA